MSDETLPQDVRQAVVAALRTDPTQGLAALAPYVAADVAEKVRRHALYLRAIVFDALGRLDEARADMLAAYDLMDARGREDLELGLMLNAARRGDATEHLQWCRRVVAVQARDPDSVGWNALTLIRLVGGEAQLSPSERADCEQIVRNGWKSCGFAGEPALDNLAASLQRVHEASRAAARGKP